VEAEGKPSDQVIEVVQKGYLLDGTVIRPARVVVAK
jgi:molecular chaperone GrpE (heat shock protein)